MSVFRLALKLANRYRVYAVVYLGLLSLLGIFTALPFLSSNQTELKEAEALVAVIDRDSSEVSQALSSFVTSQAKEVELPDQKLAWQDAMAQNRIDYLLVIPAGFGADFAAAANGGEFPALDGYLKSFSAPGQLLKMRVDSYPNQAAGYLSTVATDASQALEMAKETSSATAEAQVLPGKIEGIPEAFQLYARFTASPVFAFPIVMIAVLLLSLKRSAIQSRLMSSPVSSASHGLGLLGFCTAIGLFTWAWLFGLGLVIFGRGIELKALPLVAVAGSGMLMNALVGVSVGYLIGQVSNTEAVSNAAGNTLGMLFSFMSGAW
ncbi:MAG: ABC transporter permease, partial [Buchananella hordeovulneris]|nr:ABC transporter permease [Buchananella hordeovulneris]